MTWLGSSSVQTDTWVRIGPGIEITYEVWPDQDHVVLTLDGLSLNMGEVGLRRCVTKFSEALAAFDADHAAQPGVMSPDRTP